MDDYPEVPVQPVKIIDGVGGPMMVPEAVDLDQDDLEAGLYDDPRQTVSAEEDL